MEGMGGGDPKLVAALGAWLGWQALPLMLLLASLGGIGWALNGQRKGDRPLGERPIPFDVFACAAAFAAVPLWPWLIGRQRPSAPDGFGPRLPRWLVTTRVVWVKGVRV